MEVSAVCATPPRTPPEKHRGENPNADEVQQEDEEPEDEEQEEDEEEEEPERQKKFEDGANGRCCNLGTGMHFWTRK